MNNDMNRNPQQSRLVFSSDLDRNRDLQNPQRQSGDFIPYTPVTQPAYPYYATRKARKTKKKDWVLRILAGLAIAEVVAIGITLLLILM